MLITTDRKWHQRVARARFYRLVSEVSVIAAIAAIAGAHINGPSCILYPNPVLDAQLVASRRSLPISYMSMHEE